MPLFDDYFDQMKSEPADMTNTGGRAAGSITAALFLKQFAGDQPWAHLDIAGTAWVDNPKPWQAEDNRRRRADAEPRARPGFCG